MRQTAADLARLRKAQKTEFFQKDRKVTATWDVEETAKILWTHYCYECDDIVSFQEMKKTQPLTYEKFIWQAQALNAARGRIMVRRKS